MDNWHPVPDEKERQQAKRAYHEAQLHVPEEGLPDDLGEIEAAITIGIDSEDNFHIIANAPEEKRVMVSNAVTVLREILANYSEHREDSVEKSGEADG